MQSQITQKAVPVDSLLARYADEPEGHTDCFVTTVRANVDLASYISAFYSSWVFRPERILLSVAPSFPGSAAALERLACGKSDRFLAWTVEQRRDHEILLAEFSGATRSWLRVVPQGEALTELNFGSAIVARRDADGSYRPPSFVFSLLSGFHEFYSRMLLSAASRRLQRST